MPRKARDYFLSDFMHVMVQGDEKKFIFKTGVQKALFVNLIYKYSEEFNVEIIAYCIMGNHAHILLYSRNVENVSKMMHRCNTIYGIDYNKNKKTVGHVFRDRFRGENIYSKDYLINCIKYIHKNPVKAGMCKKCGDYYYSSYNNYKKGKMNYLTQSNYFDEDDILDIVEGNYEEMEFIGNEDEKEDINDVIKKMRIYEYIDVLPEDKLYEIYLEIRKRCKVSNDIIAEHFKMNVSRLRRMIKRCGNNMNKT